MQHEVFPAQGRSPVGPLSSEERNGQPLVGGTATGGVHGSNNRNGSDPQGTGAEAPPGDSNAALSTTKPTTSRPVLSFRSGVLTDEQGDGINVISDRRSNAYLRIGDRRTLYRIDGPKAKALLLKSAAAKGNYLRPNELREWIEHLNVCAKVLPESHDVWLRVAPTATGIEIDVGDETDRRIQVSPGRVEIVTGGSTYFHRTQAMQPFVLPADVGDLKLLDKHLNVSPVDRFLTKAWLSYTLAHPKRPGTTYPLLILGGGQGFGKTSLCRRIQKLVDPSVIEVQAFPRNEREFAVATQMSHLVIYDNVRSLRPEMSDVLCRAATGSELAMRKLFSDSDVVTLPMHGAQVLNGIHSFVNQSDLGQRCVHVTLLPIDEANRRSERAMMEEFERELPQIVRGVLDTIAGVLRHLPDVKPSCPERMIDFVRWIAAMERHQGIPGDPYQTAYSEALNRGMRDTLEEIPLAAAIMELVDGVSMVRWSGTPSELLDALRRKASRRAQSSADWPPNAISLSRRLMPLVPSLRQHGVDIRFERGRERRITITRLEGSNDD